MIRMGKAEVSFEALPDLLMMGKLTSIVASKVRPSCSVLPGVGVIPLKNTTRKAYRA